MSIRVSFLAIAACSLSVATSFSADWPQFRGPSRDGVSKETGLLKAWPEKGPPLTWTAKGLGGGYSTVSIAGGRIYTLGNKGKETHLIALDGKTGAVLWTAPVGPEGGSLGCTPTVDGDRVYALGQAGDLVCIDTAGKRIWHRNLVKDFGGKMGGWHYCESPLVDGEHLIVTPGGKMATMVALDKKTGDTVWKCPIPVEHNVAGYSSVVVAEVGGVKHYVQLIDGGLIGVGTDGQFLWKFEKLGPNTANVPTPIVFGEYVFGSAGYGKGAALLKLKGGDGHVSATQVYFVKELTNKHGGVIRVGEYLYGDTDDRGKPFCAAVKSGEVIWQRASQGKGSGSVAVAAADGMLYLHYQNGIVVLAEASPDGYKETGSFAVPKTDGASWAHPVVCDGHLYLREGDLLYCYDVRESR